MTKRNTDTKKYIKDALAKLLSQKRFENITISDLSRTAGINRGTFYLHYTDKYDMMEKLKNETLEDLFGILSHDSIFTSKRIILLKLLSYLKDNFDFIFALSQTSYVNFSQTIKNFSYSFLITIPRFEEAVTKYYGIPYDYAIELYLSSIESIISLWVANGGKEDTEEITDIILKVVSLDKMI